MLQEKGSLCHETRSLLLQRTRLQHKRSLLLQHWKTPDGSGVHGSGQLYLLYCTEKVNHLKVNRARLRKTLRKTYLKVNRKVQARFLRKVCARFAQGPRKVCARPAQGPRKARARPAQGPRKTRARPGQDPRKTRARPALKKTSVSQTIDLVIAMNPG